MIKLTERAQQHLQAALEEEGLSLRAMPLRVAVELHADGGYSYYFGFIGGPDPNDELDEARDIVDSLDGYTIVVRDEHADLPGGTTIDYVNDKALGAGFTFSNPNVVGVV